MADSVSCGASAMEAWQNALETPEGQVLQKCILTEEQNVLNDFFGLLGTCPRTVQQQSVRMGLESLQGSVAQAQEAYGKKGKMFRTMGMLLGAMTAILML